LSSIFFKIILNFWERFVIDVLYDEIGKPNGLLNKTYFGVFYNLKESLGVNHTTIDLVQDRCVYPIEPLGGIRNILYENNFIEHLNDDIKKLIKKNICHVLISSPSEGNLKYGDIENLLQNIDNANLPQKQFTFAQGNYNLKKQFNDFEHDLNLIIMEHKLDTSKESFYYIHKGWWKKSDNPPTINYRKDINDDIRPYRYISYNKSLRPDRVALLSLLLKEDLLKYGLISMGSENAGSAGTYQPWPTKFDFVSDKKLKNDVIKWSKKLEKLRPMKIEGDVDVEKIDVGENSNLNPCGYTFAKQYRKVYFQIVTEDVFEADSMFFSQTTYRPLVQNLPFLMFGTNDMMNNLKEIQGFKTFDFMIDENYDSINNNDKRLLAVVEEVKRLCHMDIDKLHQLFISNLDKLEYNHEKMIDGVYNSDERNFKNYLLSLC
tara:strand:+ start:1013 stop:2311 length:1299 start_codon:yes stop_codon:yes gene_type:complete